MSKVSAKLLSTLCLLLLITAALAPAAGAAETEQATPPATVQPTIPTIKIPTGQYMTNCHKCKYEGTYFACTCMDKDVEDTTEGIPTSTKIDLTTCTVDSDGFYNLSTSKGQWVCTTS
jgi:hypothetical protein